MQSGPVTYVRFKRGQLPAQLRGSGSAWERIRVKRFLVLVALAAFCAPSLPASARAEPLTKPSLQAGTVLEAAERLKPGQFLWSPQVAPQGPVLMIVSLKTQRAVIYRNGVPIGISTVSSGRPGYETPTGVFVILQKHVEHYSNLYDNAPMPFMQRLTWGGIALHAGNLPGYPASHGCIRLPHEFARLLYQVTHRGMTVIITDLPAVPRVAPVDELLNSGTGVAGPSGSKVEWDPGRAPGGPLSIVVSAADRRAVVLRDGRIIGSSPIEIDGNISRASAYLLNGVVAGKRQWVRIALPGQDDTATESLRNRIRVPETFRRLVDPVLKIGTTVIVTADSLQSGTPGVPLTVIENDRSN